MKRLTRKIAALVIITMLAGILTPISNVKAAEEDTAITDLMVDYVMNPVGIDNTEPRFSWEMESNVIGQEQTAYQIEVKKWDVFTKSPGEVVWDSTKVEGDKSVDIPYGGDALESSSSYSWNVTVWDKDENKIVSDVAFFEMGLLEDDAFDGVKWIRMPLEGEPEPGEEEEIDTSIYVVETNFKFQDAVGFVFAAKDQTNFFMWQLNNNMENDVEGSWLRPHRWSGNGALFNPENQADYQGYPLDEELNNGQSYNLKLVIDTEANIVTTILDDTVINELSCGNVDLTYRKLGFRMATNPSAGFQEKVWVYDLKVTANDETLLFYQDFTWEDDTQIDGGVVQDGCLYLTYGTNRGDKVFLEKNSSVFYRFDTDFTIQSGKAGIFYGSNLTGSQFYYSQVNPNYNNAGPAVVQHWKPSGGYAFSFDSGKILNITKEDMLNQKHHFTLTGSPSKEVNIYIDGKRAIYHDHLNDFEFGGKVGFNSDAGDNVRYDNIIVRINGVPKVFADFSAEENIFDGGVIEDEALRVENAATVPLIDVIGNAKPPVVTPEEPFHYTVETDITLTGDAAGIVFSASDSSNMFMWQLNGINHNGNLYLRPHIWENGNAHYTQYERDISQYFDYETEILNQEIHVKLDVTNDAVKTYINDVLVDTFEVTASTPGRLFNGRVGFRSGETKEIFVVGNLKAVSYEDETEIVKIQCDFENGISPFVGANSDNNIIDGKFYVKGNAGVILTKEESGAGMPMFRKSFETQDKEIVSAKVYASSLGIYDLYVNGERVGYQDEDGETAYDEMKPGWTDYNSRILYYTHDITQMILSNENNVLLATVGTGWWTGRISYNTYGTKDMAFLAKMIITYSDGSQDVIVTDKTWLSSDQGVIREADIWDGETYDANYPSAAEISQSGYVADDSWQMVRYSTDFKGIISANVGQPIQVRKELERSPKSITLYQGTKDNGSDYGEIKITEVYSSGEAFELKKGVTAVYDLGQNMVGWPSIQVEAAAGTEIKLNFAEMLNDSGQLSRGNDGPSGSLYTAAYRSAVSTGIYIANGSGIESYHPAFSFYGFRYVSIKASSDIKIHNFKAEVLGSAIPEIGTLVTSNASVNQLISNVLWGQRSNYLSVPTDCPQRDERLGWTGDTQVFVGAASYNANVAGFFHKWANDAMDSQVGGEFTDVVPRSNVVGSGNAIWADAGIIVPYTMYQMYGDTQIITNMYASMEKYMDWLAARGYVGAKIGYGDWLAYESNDDDVRKSIACAFYAYDCQLMAQMSDAIGKTDKAEAYRIRNQEIKEYYQNEFLNSDGTLKSKNSTQTCYLWALKAGVFKNDADKEAALNRLLRNIKANGNCLGTGFAGTSILNQVLSDEGAADMAYTLLLQRDDPSWMYSIDQGATTIWERWNSYTKENGFGNVSMNSFNHYAYGAVLEWMYSDMLGIAPDPENPGFKHILLQPQPDTRPEDEMPENQERITHVKGTYHSAHGLIQAEWNWSEKGFEYQAVIPANTTAKVSLPIAAEEEYTVNGKSTSELTLLEDGIELIGIEDGKTVFNAVSGSYHFLAGEAPVDDVSYIALKELYDSVSGVNSKTKSKYTAVSWKLFEAALNKTQSILENLSSSQLEVDEAVDELRAAILNLTIASATTGGSSSTGTSSGSTYKWIQDSIGWKLTENNFYVTNQWKQVKGHWYYLEANGYMKTGWLLYQNQWYYLKSDGAMAEGWLKDPQDGYWYYLQPITGAMQTGWYMIESKWYYLNKSTGKSTGWSQNSVTGAWTYQIEDAIPTGSLWCNAITPDGYAVDTNGVWIR